VLAVARAVEVSERQRGSLDDAV